MARMGMDVDVVESIARELAHKADAVETLRANVASQIGRAHGRGMWTGGRAERYVADWRASDARARGVVGDLRAFGLLLLAEARQQRDASNSSGSASVGSGAPLAPDPRPSEPHFPPAAHAFRDLANAAYDGAPVPRGYTQLSKEELLKLGIGPKDLDDASSGFHATVMRDSAGNIVVSYRGTEDLFSLGASPDRDTDVAGAVALTRQTELAVRLALTVKYQVGGDHVVFTGHSLGGRLAAASSMVTSAPAVTFNAAGVGNTEVLYALTAAGRDPSLMDYVGGFFGLGKLAQSTHSDLIVNYRTARDELTFLQEQAGLHLPPAAGRQVTVPNTGGHSLSEFGDLTAY